MKIALCIKQVPDTADIKWTENNTIQREGVESIINPFDMYAIETALRLKDRLKDVHITVMSMGPPQAEDIPLVERLAREGRDEWAIKLALSENIPQKPAITPIYTNVIQGRFPLQLH